MGSFFPSFEMVERERPLEAIDVVWVCPATMSDALTSHRGSVLDGFDLADLDDDARDLEPLCDLFGRAVSSRSSLNSLPRSFLSSLAAESSRKNPFDHLGFGLTSS